MKILSLRLTNFKGIRDFTLDTGGGNVSIYADNAVGKTSLFDAMTWLLFGKDSANKKDFDIKTLDATGKVIPAIDHDVEGVFETNGRQLTLKKSYKEKYTKKRGSATSEFTGHTTDHYVNGVPVPEKDYAAKIAEIINEDIFKLLTSPTYFNLHLPWQKRREILLSICGDLTDQEVIVSNSNLSTLPTILGDRKLDDHRKVIAARRSKINEELKEIPARIDEATKALPDVSGIEPEVSLINAKIVDLKKRVQTKNQEIARIQSGGEVAEKTKALRELEGRLLDIRNRHREETEGKVQGKREQLGKLRNRIAETQHFCSTKEGSIRNNSFSIKEYEDRIVKLREEWHSVNGQKFEFEQSSTCPTCGRSLPETQLEEAREKALAAFHLDKAKRLEEINTQGKQTKSKVDSLKTENESLEKEIASLKDSLDGMEIEVATLQEQIDVATQGATDVTENPEYKQALQEKALIEGQITELKAGTYGQITAVKAEINLLESELSGLEAALAQHDAAKRGRARIEELKRQEKALAKEYEELEKQLYLTEEFIRTKVRMLDEKINSRFKLARFKLFDVQVNSGISECCETIYQGIPYSSGLNNGAKIQVGMDIIRTLSEHFGFYPVIFVDNAESVTILPEMDAQVIRLIKPEITEENRHKYSRLVVEIEKPEERLKEVV